MFKFSNKKIWLSALLVMVAAGALLLFLPTYRGGGELDEVTVTDSTEVQEMVCEYGIPVDRYNLKYGIVQPRQSLGSILGGHGVDTRRVRRAPHP